MKMFMRCFLVSVASMIVGGVLGWQAFNYRIRLRVIPFDRSHNVLIELAYNPTIDFTFSTEGNTFKWGTGEGKVEEDLDNRLARLAHFTTSVWVVASFNSDVTIQQIRDIDARIRNAGFSSPRILIEDNRNTRAENEERLFSEIRIGLSNDFYWHNVEWYIDSLQEEATKRMKSQRDRKTK